ncbi:class I SAM-dependent methyltransferase, partial [Candidatus Bathyarchaeota archaeon]|nr:class I SAM-dependent methyltransferase [Candidatus Bathyarchaeota archaeon]
ALGSALNLPFRDDLFDLAVSFQVLEHIEPSLANQYLKEVRRVLRVGGTFILSTPNRRLRLLPHQRPWNPDHKKEYDARELKALINKVFEDVKITGLFARKKVYYVEYLRVRQNPWFIYILKPTTSILKTVIPKHITNMVKGFFRKKKVARKYNERLMFPLKTSNSQKEI